MSKVTQQPAGEAEAWGLIIKVHAGSRTSRERLAADVHARSTSKADPLFTSELLRRFEGDGQMHLVTAARPRRDLIDRLMRFHRKLDATAVLMREGTGERHEAEYMAGLRIGDWQTFAMHATDLIALVNGAAVDIARLSTVTKDASEMAEELMFAVLRANESRRDVGDTFMRIHWRLPSTDGITEIGDTFARTFASLRFEFFAVSNEARIASAQAVYRYGVAVLPWHYVDDARETISTINRRWSKMTDGEGQEMVLREHTANDQANPGERPTTRADRRAPRA